MSDRAADLQLLVHTQLLVWVGAAELGVVFHMHLQVVLDIANDTARVVRCVGVVGKDRRWQHRFRGALELPPVESRADSDSDSAIARTAAGEDVALCATAVLATALGAEGATLPGVGAQGGCASSSVFWRVLGDMMDCTDATTQEGSKYVTTERQDCAAPDLPQCKLSLM